MKTISLKEILNGAVDKQLEVQDEVNKIDDILKLIDIKSDAYNSWLNKKAELQAKLALLKGQEEEKVKDAGKESFREGVNGPSDQDTQYLAKKMYNQHWDNLSTSQQDAIYKKLGSESVDEEEVEVKKEVAITKKDDTYVVENLDVTVDKVKQEVADEEKLDFLDTITKDEPKQEAFNDNPSVICIGDRVRIGSGVHSNDFGTVVKVVPNEGTYEIALEGSKDKIVVGGNTYVVKAESVIQNEKDLKEMFKAMAESKSNYYESALTKSDEKWMVDLFLTGMGSEDIAQMLRIEKGKTITPKGVLYIVQNFKESFDSELAMGIELEKEHTEDPAVAEKIARDHLAEIPDYYTILQSMEAGAQIGEESLREAFKAGDKVITPDGKKGYIYQVQDDKFRVTSQPQTGLIGWFKGSELKQESLRESIATISKDKRIMSDGKSKYIVKYDGNTYTTDESKASIINRLKAKGYIIKSESLKEGMGTDGVPRNGKPKTDDERKATHGDGELPPKGTGLKKEGTQAELDDFWKRKIDNAKKMNKSSDELRKILAKKNNKEESLKEIIDSKILQRARGIIDSNDNPTSQINDLVDDGYSLKDAKDLVIAIAAGEESLKESGMTRDQTAQKMFKKNFSDLSNVEKNKVDDDMMATMFLGQ